MFSRTVEYALRAVCVIARGEERLRTTDEIATATRVPAEYLRKVLQSLGRAGLIRTRRGIGGGVALLRPREEITILDVVNAVDPIQRIDSCPLGLAEHGVQLCSLHSQLDDALGAIEDIFRQTTIADLLDPGKGKPARCRFPTAVIK